MLERKKYRALDRFFPFKAVLTDQRTRQEQTVSLRKIDTRYNETVCVVTGGEGQQVWTEKELEMLDEK